MAFLEPFDQRGEFRVAAAPDAAGLFVLAMGKMGAGELNYSSDIDLVVFFDPETAPLKADLPPTPIPEVLRPLDAPAAIAAAPAATAPPPLTPAPQAEGGGLANAIYGSLMMVVISRALQTAAVRRPIGPAPAISATVSSSFIAIRVKAMRMSRADSSGSPLLFGPSGST